MGTKVMFFDDNELFNKKLKPLQSNEEKRSEDSKVKSKPVAVVEAPRVVEDRKPEPSSTSAHRQNEIPSKSSLDSGPFDLFSDAKLPNFKHGGLSLFSDEEEEDDDLFSSFKSKSATTNNLFDEGSLFGPTSKLPEKKDPKETKPSPKRNFFTEENDLFGNETSDDWVRDEKPLAQDRGGSKKADPLKPPVGEDTSKLVRDKAESQKKPTLLEDTSAKPTLASASNPMAESDDEDLFSDPLNLRSPASTPVKADKIKGSQNSSLFEDPFRNKPTSLAQKGLVLSEENDDLFGNSASETDLESKSDLFEDPLDTQRDVGRGSFGVSRDLFSTGASSTTQVERKENGSPEMSSKPETKSPSNPAGIQDNNQKVHERNDPLSSPPPSKHPLFEDQSANLSEENEAAKDLFKDQSSQDVDFTRKKTINEASSLAGPEKPKIPGKPGKKSNSNLPLEEGCLFDDDDLFTQQSSPSQKDLLDREESKNFSNKPLDTPPKPVNVSKKTNLFGEDEENDLLFTSTKPPESKAQSLKENMRLFEEKSSSSKSSGSRTETKTKKTESRHKDNEVPINIERGNAPGTLDAQKMDSKDAIIPGLKEGLVSSLRKDLGKDISKAFGGKPREVKKKASQPPGDQPVGEDIFTSDDLVSSDISATSSLTNILKNRARVKTKRRPPSRKQGAQETPETSGMDEEDSSQIEKSDESSEESKRLSSLLSPSTDEEDLFVLPPLALQKEKSVNDLFSGSILLSPGQTIDEEREDGDPKNFSNLSEELASPTDELDDLFLSDKKTEPIRLLNDLSDDEDLFHSIKSENPTFLDSVKSKNFEAPKGQIEDEIPHPLAKEENSTHSTLGTARKLEGSLFEDDEELEKLFSSNLPAKPAPSRDSRRKIVRHSLTTLQGSSTAPFDDPLTSAGQNPD